MFDVEYGLSTNCAPNIIQNTDILITLGYERRKQRT